MEILNTCSLLKGKIYFGQHARLELEFLRALEYEEPTGGNK